MWRGFFVCGVLRNKAKKQVFAEADTKKKRTN
jgi:hypothetical protein